MYYVGEKRNLLMFCADYIAAFFFHASIVALVNKGSPSVASNALGVDGPRTSTSTLPFLFGGTAGFFGEFSLVWVLSWYVLHIIDLSSSEM